MLKKSRDSKGRFIRKITIHPNLLIALYWGNCYSTFEIGKLFDCSHVVILRRLKECNIPSRSLYKASKLCDNSGRFEKGNIPWNVSNNYSNERKDDRKSFRTLQKQWAKCVYDFYNYTCQICGKRKCELNAHHIKPWRDYPEYRFDVSNGLCLCDKCHINLHRIEKMNIIKKGD